MVEMNTITLQLSQKQALTLEKIYRNKAQQPPTPAIRFFAKTEGCTISLYHNYKALFQGKNAAEASARFAPVSPFPQAGSDEVGTGDYFGPVCVCACIVQDLKALEGLAVQDSKTLTDALILKNAPVLMERLPHSLLIVSNEKYNQVHKQHNMNQIKALLHNQAYLNLQKKYTLPPLCVIDQFTPEARYYQYLGESRETFTKIHFETKAESKYPAVACASLIARYGFLKALEAMSEHYQFHFPKGAGAQVDSAAKAFVEQYSQSELDRVAKLHFANSAKLL
ncbi:MAG: ribonuclease HIII [Erysipelotrichaceae bacterium]|jgi:ribonuclease HIII|nr:ribonuclease HIII [Erysipelotrichaceae bacterium]